MVHGGPLTHTCVRSPGGATVDLIAKAFSSFHSSTVEHHAQRSPSAIFSSIRIICRKCQYCISDLCELIDTCASLTLSVKYPLVTNTAMDW